MSKNTDDTLRNFGMANLMIEATLNNVEKNFSLDLGRRLHENVDNTYYPQFDDDIRKQAARMASYYEIFYCLEQSIRTLIIQRLSESGENWWTEKIPESVRVEAEKRHADEVNKGITPRSYNMIDYTNFGELSIIIIKNWDDTFNDMFTSRDAVRNVLNMLNTLRGLSHIVQCWQKMRWSACI